MTDEEARALGLRLTACEGWRWMPGMLAMQGGALVGTFRCLRVPSYTDGDSPLAAYLCAEADVHGPKWYFNQKCWPDLRDPATRGCVLELVREAYGDPNITLAYDLKTIYPKTWTWAVVRRDEKGEIVVLSEHTCREEALALALEAAP